MTFGKVAMWGVVGEEYKRERSEFAKKKKKKKILVLRTQLKVSTQAP